MKKLFITITALFSIPLLLQAQTIEPPPEGKSVVYFVRVSSLGFAINFSYFDKDKFIGKFNGPKYMRYECEPGEHLFWAHSENFDFITADLDTGKIYFIEAIPQMGAIKAGVGLEPITPADSLRIKKILKLMEKKPGEKFSEPELEEGNRKAQNIIEKSQEKYQKALKKGNKVGRLEKSMFYQK